VYGKFATTLQERQKDKNAPIPDQVGPVIRLLEEIAAESPRLDEGSFKEVKDLLGYLEEHLSRDMRGSREQVAYDLLTELGLFTVNTNLALLRYRPALTFSAHETAAALQIHVPQTLTEYPAGSLRSREDLTNLNCYTIDDESTQDMDDAISLEQTEEGYRLGIHISDVAALIPSGSPLDQAAHRRATSIYLPEQVIPMLPDGISHDRCSLVAGAVRPVTTVLIDVSPHFEIRGTQIVPAIIKVREKLSYDEVDRRLESHDRELEALYNITAAREGERLADGANNVGKRDAYVIIRGPHDLVLHEIDEQGAARTIVSELMILANTVFAQYAKRNGLPFLYRTQEGPDVSLDFLDEIPEGPARDYALRGKLKRSIMSTAPGRHSSLGLDLYTQMTSPIRRYADLLNQRQILSHLLDGKPQYTIDEIERIAFEVEEPLSHANFLSRESKRFWLLRYLEERLKREPITVTATVVRNDMKLPMVELDSLYITVPLRTDSRVALGEQCTVQVKEVSAFRDQVRLEVVR
jgi:exoribonuclease-2